MIVFNLVLLVAVAILWILVGIVIFANVKQSEDL